MRSRKKPVKQHTRKEPGPSFLIAKSYESFIQKPDGYYYLHFPPGNTEDIIGLKEWAASKCIPLEHSNTHPSGGCSFRIFEDHLHMLPAKGTDAWNDIPFGLPSFYFYGEKAGQLDQRNVWRLSKVNTIRCLTKSWTQVKFARRRAKPKPIKKRRVR